MKNISQLYNGLPLIGKIIVWLIIALLIYIAYRKLMIYMQNLKVHQLSGSQVDYNGTNIDLGGKALVIYDSFYNYYGGLAEDEQTAISALKSVPNQHIAKLSQIYFNLYAKDLKQDFTKYCDFNEVSNKFI